MLRKFTATMLLVLAIAFGQGLYRIGNGSRLAPGILNYQGFLTDTLSNPVTNPSVSMTFTIYDAVSAGNAKWTEAQSAVSVDRGIFHVLLGTVTAIPDSVFNRGANRWLEIAVAGQTLAPRTRIVSAPYALYASKSQLADTAEFARNAVGSGWVISGNDMYSGVPGNIGIGTSNPRYKLDLVGIFCGGSDNQTTGGYSFVGGGHYNNVTQDFSLVSGGEFNNAAGPYASVTGGSSNYGGIDAEDTAAVVVGGYYNEARAKFSFIGGGIGNRAYDRFAAVVGGAANNACSLLTFVGGGQVNNAVWMMTTVGGGGFNTAYKNCATVGGGYMNRADSGGSFVGGGEENRAAGNYAAISGGYRNCVRASASTVAGGEYDTVSGAGGFAAGSHSVIPSGFSNSAVFNGQVTTASGETRVNILAKASGTFSIDHPLDPQNKILNHYFVESPEMVLIYRGIARIGSDGRATIHLPDYFDALNQNPMVQLTGVGTPETPYLVENVRNNRFVIAGKPGGEVHWLVTGERKDPSAAATKILIPVEQAKTGDLAGRSLDDNFLYATMAQLEAMGYGSQFSFRTAAAKKRYEEFKQRCADYSR